ncbi:MAG: sulfurtransferase [Betaproteobacteria bacterium]|nr:sulfurtransferase [Betaproteobacteria bacterium]
MRQISPLELSDWMADGGRARPLLLDVRESWEFDVSRIEGARSMPMRSVPARFVELDREADVVVVCQHGARSFQVAMFLEQQGFGRIFNLAGGMSAWSHQVVPQMRRY